MGVFAAKLTVLNPALPSRSEEIEVMVDTGASYSWVFRSRLAAMGVHPTRRMAFRTIEGRIIERELAAVFVKVDGSLGGDTVVLAEPGDSEVLGAHTLESLGLTADPVRKLLVPAVGLALFAGDARIYRRNSRIVEAINLAIKQGRLTEPFTNEEFRVACPGFGRGTYRAFLWKHSRGNPGLQSEFFERVASNRFRRV